MTKDIISNTGGPGRLIHISWFVFDVCIIISSFKYIKFDKKWKKSRLIVLYFVLLISLFVIFSIFDKGMLISVFAIDLVMAVDYGLFALKKRLKRNLLSVLICSGKLLGDLFAWLTYMNTMLFVFYIGFAILLLNTICLIAVIVNTNLETKKR